MADMITMGEMMASLWDYFNVNNSSNYEDMEELGQKLLCTTLELEKLKSEVMEEMRKNKEHVKRLAYLLKIAIQERDEARDQLHKFLTTKSTTSTTASDNFPQLTNSNTIQSSSHGSSPRSCFSSLVAPTLPPMDPITDHASLMIDTLAKGKPLPPKGKLMQAVQGTGPLLQTLLLAGPLPQWRNPPPLQPYQTPPVSVKGCPAVGNLGSSFGNVASGTCNNTAMTNGFGFDSLAKRPKLC